MIKNCLLLLNIVFFSLSGFSQIWGPQATEVEYSYVTTFQIPADSDESTDRERAEFHASHLFGIFHSPTLIKKFKLDPNLVGGLGGARSPSKIKILSSEVVAQNTLEIKYQNQGRMILHSSVAEQILKTGKFSVPMPSNPYSIYNPDCTDEHYNSFGDYWYFYDIFKKDCKYLSQAPYAIKTEIQFKSVTPHSKTNLTQMPTLRGENGNGSVFSIAVIQGFADSKNDPEDSGRINFKDTNDYFLSMGFELTKLKSKTAYPLYLFTKEITLDNGQTIQVEIKHLLVETAMESKSKVFAEFFKDAVYNADVIIYGGHSGLGGNLDIPSLEQKVGELKFNHNKKQIFFFDSCSSYSYYLQHFGKEKTKSKIDIMTNGLSSYFHTSQLTFKTFMKYLLSEKNKNFTWQEILTDMESVLDGETYLLNVGGI